MYIYIYIYIIYIYIYFMNQKMSINPFVLRATVSSEATGTAAVGLPDTPCPSLESWAPQLQRPPWATVGHRGPPWQRFDEWQRRPSEASTSLYCPSWRSEMRGTCHDMSLVESKESSEKKIRRLRQKTFAQNK